MSPIDFDLLDLENDSEYSRQINRVLKITSHTESIEKTVLKASQSIKSGVRSFVIYGEPQSGKTEMMICLTAKLLDDGFKNIVILVNDNVELQNQNLERFRKSGLSPSPKSLQELKNSEALKNTFNTVIFCKNISRSLSPAATQSKGSSSNWFIPHIQTRRYKCTIQIIIISSYSSYHTPLIIGRIGIFKESARHNLLSRIVVEIKIFLVLIILKT